MSLQEDQHQPNLNGECDNIIVGIDIDHWSIADQTLKRSSRMCPVNEMGLEQLIKNTINLDAETTHLGSSERMNDIAKMTENNAESTFCYLTSIHEDFLNQIVRHLNLIDVTQLAATCSQMRNFADDFVFPQKATDLHIRISSEMTVNLSIPMDDLWSWKISLKSLECSLSYFGEFVKSIKFECDLADQSKIIHSIVFMLGLCQNVTSVFLNNLTFTPNDTHALKHQMEMLKNLKELELSECLGIIGSWPMSLESPSPVEKLTIVGVDKFSDNFFEYFKNLSSLAVEFHITSDWSADDLAKVFDVNGHGLKRLALKFLEFVRGYETVGLLIIDKLLNLESFELNITYSADLEYMVALPYLKSLTILCIRETSINALLRSISDNGKMEKLKIVRGYFDIEDENASPLTFSKLLSCDWGYQQGGMSNFLSTMTKADMPAIQCIRLHCFTVEETHGLLALLESKKTLKMLGIALSHDYEDDLFPFSFWNRLIAILKEPCTPKRPLINLMIQGKRLTTKEVSKIAWNRLK